MKTNKGNVTALSNHEMVRYLFRVRTIMFINYFIIASFSAFFMFLGKQYDFEQLRRKDAMNPWSETWGVSYFIVKDFLIQQKSDNI